MPNSQKQRVLIVGGGIAGLTAAFYLEKQDNLSVTLAESGAFGGMIQTKHQDGFTLEQGPNIFVMKPAMNRLLEELNLTDLVVYPKISTYRQLIWCDDRAMIAPKSLRQFLSSTLLSMKEKVRLVRAFFKRGAFRPQHEDESVLDFFARGFGERVVMRLLDPALKGIYGGSVRTLSARSLFPKLWECATKGMSLLQYVRTKEKRPSIFVLKGGARVLTDTLQNSLSKTTIKQQAVITMQEKATGCFAVSFADDSIADFDTVIVSTAGAASARFLAAFEPELAKRLKGVSTTALSVVHLAVDDNAPIDMSAFGIVFPERTERRVLGIMFNSVLFPHMAPKQKHLLTVCLGGPNSLRESVHDEAGQTAQWALKRFLGISAAEVLATCTWPSAIPQLEVGHHEIEAALREFSKRRSGVYFCGTDLGGVGVPDRIATVSDLMEHIDL